MLGRECQLGGTDEKGSAVREYRFSRRALVFSTVFDAMERERISEYGTEGVEEDCGGGEGGGGVAERS